MGNTPLCFVVMPFGTKPDGMGGMIDFDLIYRTLISPAIAAAGMSAMRADDDVAFAGNVVQASIKRVIGTPVAVFDITGANAAVIYELGVRHAMRQQVTLMITVQGRPIPWNLSHVRVLSYELNAAGRPENVEQFQRLFAEHVRARQRPDVVDSPLYMLFPELRPPALENFTAEPRSGERRVAEELKRRIMEARRLGTEELSEVEGQLGDISAAAPDVVLTLFDAYRASGAWGQMIDLAGRMPSSISSSARVQEQLALALNQTDHWAQAEEVLQGLLSKNGPSSETYGVLGRVYKDQWEEAQRRGDGARAEKYLSKAIDAYLQGFETDWRDPYPGVNAVTLMTMREPPDPRRDETLPVVLYAVKRKLAANRGDYWDAATLLELHALTGNEKGAQEILPRVLTEGREPWQSATTARNLGLIRETLDRRGVPVDWIAQIEKGLSPSASAVGRSVGPARTPFREGVAMGRAEDKKHHEVRDFLDAQGRASSTSPGDQVFKTYKVKAGDSLSKIAKSVYGDSNEWKRIFEANADILKASNKIYPGQKLKIPRS